VHACAYLTTHTRCHPVSRSIAFARKKLLLSVFLRPTHNVLTVQLVTDAEETQTGHSFKTAFGMNFRVLFHAAFITL